MQGAVNIYKSPYVRAMEALMQTRDRQISEYCESKDIVIVQANGEEVQDQL